MKSNIQSMVFKYVSVLLFILLSANYVSASELSIQKSLLTYGLTKPVVKISDTSVEVHYFPLVSEFPTLDQEADRLAEISKIVSVQAPTIPLVVIRQIFEDGQIMEVYVKVKDARDFLVGSINTEDFLTRVNMRLLTRGLIFIPETCEPSKGDNCQNSQACSCYPNETCLPGNKDADSRGCVITHTPSNAHLVGPEYICNKKYTWNKEYTDCVPDTGVTGDSENIYPVADSHVYAYSYRNWNKANWGKYNVLGAGWHPAGGEKRTYLKFDISGVDPNSFDKATLKLFHYHTGGSPSLSLGVHAVTGTWQEGGGTYHLGQTEKPAAPGEVSWVQQPTFDFSPVVSFKPGSEIGKYIEVDITPLVKAWLSGKPNYGLMIKPVGIMSGRAPESSYGFYSREHQDVSKRPVLVLSASSISDTPTGSKHPLGDITRITDYPQAAENIRGAPCGIDRTFVFSLFQCILERDPENREIDEQIRDLQSGMSRKEIVIRFFKSREYLNNNKTGSESYKDAYQAVLGRNPSSEEMRTFPRTYPFMMAVKLFNTEEYRNLCQSNTGGNLTTTSTGTDSTGLTLDFETGRTNGWTKTGTAFNYQPTYGDNPTARRRGQPSKHVGNYWVGTFEKYQGSGSQTPGSVQGDGPIGTLTSNVFTIPTGSLSFLVGGGSSFQTRVELLVSGNKVLSVSGRNTETMHRVEWDLNPWAGQKGQIRLVDNASGGWGHINADDFRFSHSTPPQPDVKRTAIKEPPTPKPEPKPESKPELKPKPEPKQVSEDGYQSIGREAAPAPGQQEDASERPSKPPKGHSTKYGF